MPAARIPVDEEARLAALRSYDVLDTEAEEAYDALTTLAAEICATPIALVSLVDEARQWFKSRVGIDATETPREMAFCAHAILEESPTIVSDARVDERFADNALVTDDPHIRFYAGVPLRDRDGHALGTLCVIDQDPRELEPSALLSLRALARLTVEQLECRRVAAELAGALKRVERLEGLVPMCAGCKSVREGEDYWRRVEEFVLEQTGREVTHGLCPECVRRFYGEYLPSPGDA